MAKARHNARVSAAVGAGLWLAFLFIPISDSNETELIQRILLLGILVIVPLGLSLIHEAQSQTESVLYRLAVSAQPIAAAAGAISFLLDPGGPAAALVGSWLLVTAVIGLLGLSRILERRSIYVREVAIDAGMIYLPVGAVWLVATRLGIQPMGFGDTIVLLTAVHFHFAGFAAPVLAGLAGRVLVRSPSISKAFAVAVVCILSGTPLVAAGITFSPRLALIGAIVISAGLLVLAILVLGWVLRSLDSFVAQTLLVISSLSSVFAMILACLYAYSLVARTVIVDIPQMALTHGILNSFGFALSGLLAWLVVYSPTSKSATEEGRQ
jgi:hypothetical protein